MNKLKLFFLSVCLTAFVSGTDAALAASGSTPTTTPTTATSNQCGSNQCYKIGASSTSKKGLYINCYNSEIGRGDQQICSQYFSGSSKATCVMLESTIDNEPMATCDTSEAAFCRTDDDCKAKSSQAITCVDKVGQMI